MPIGVFDSGLGGLTVLAALREALPTQSIIYLGDNAHAPYGARGREDIIARTRQSVDILFNEGCALVIIACNTASAIALRPLQQNWLPMRAPQNRMLGVFVPVIESITGRDWGDHGPPTPAPQGARRIALFATEATVRSRAFIYEAQKRAAGLEICQQACPGLVEALEAGNDAAAMRLVRDFSARLMARAGYTPEIAILGCTHYPLAYRWFRVALPARARILSQPEIVAQSLCDYLRRRPRFADNRGGVCYLTTGDPALVSDQARRYGAESLVFDRA